MEEAFKLEHEKAHQMLKTKQDIIKQIDLNNEDQLTDRENKDLTADGEINLGSQLKVEIQLSSGSKAANMT